MPDPHISTIAKNYATVAGIMLAGLWAFWRWGFEQVLRKVREVPSLDGGLSALGVSLNEDKVLTTVEAQWRNRGIVPVNLNTDATCMQVYKLDQGLKFGPINTQISSISPIYRVYPLKGLKGFILEPNTDSLLKEHLVLNKGEIYLFRYKLYRKKRWWSKADCSWEKDLIWRYQRGVVIRSEGAERRGQPLKMDILR